MSNLQKVFKKRIAESWHVEFPFLKPVDINETPHVAKGCNFLCDLYGKTRSCYYFVRLNFSKKRVGEFSIGITISPSPTRSILEHDLATPVLSSKSIGMFGIWKFLNRPRFDWCLIDLETRRNQLFAKLGKPEIIFEPNCFLNAWQPSTYDQPIEKIVDEAIFHVNNTLRTSVFPLLQITTL